MIIKEYKDSKMLLTHPSGHVDSYTEKDVERRIERIMETVIELNIQLFDLKGIKAEISASNEFKKD